ncbi:MAG TPA: hypothetical protein VG815_10085 [Chloroflexota bacterium]|jgi:hypothetical protein|nr:hypothetical protein [Chloroflexota bacterium]
MKLNVFRSGSSKRQSTARIAIVASAVMLASLISSTLGVAGASAGSTGPNGPTSQLVLTHNGAIVQQLPAPKGANDLHYVWQNLGCKGQYAFPYVIMYWTENGRVIGKGLAPCKANDFEFAWNVDGMITTASWTVNGLPMQPGIKPPAGANDVHVFLTGRGRLLKAWWTLNGKPLQSIQIPGYVNDMHWYGYPIPVGVVIGSPSFLFFTHNGKVVGGTQAPGNANDLHYVWTKGKCRGAYEYPLVTLIFTIDGRVIGKTLAPCKANDFEFSWNPQGMVTGATWTQDGRPMAQIALPTSAPVNDVHLYLGGHTRLLSAWWTFNGQPISTIKLPGYVNDMHWYGYPPKTPGKVAGVTESVYR